MGLLINQTAESLCLSSTTLTKFVSFMLWHWFYFLTYEHSPDKNPEWCSRVLTVVHATVAIVIGSTQCKWRTLTIHHFTRRILLCQYLMMLWSWGYFAFDLLWCLIYWTDSIVVLCHHGAALFAINRYMQKYNTGCTYACSMLVLELTNPLLQTRWFLKKSGYGKSILYMMVEVLFLTLFISLRVILGTYAMFWVLTSDFFDLEEKLTAAAFYVISIIFIYDIVGYVRYKYKKEITIFKREFYYATQFPNDFDGRNVPRDYSLLGRSESRLIDQKINSDTQKNTSQELQELPDQLTS